MLNISYHRGHRWQLRQTLSIIADELVRTIMILRQCIGSAILDDMDRRGLLLSGTLARRDDSIVLKRWWQWIG